MQEEDRLNVLRMMVNNLCAWPRMLYVSALPLLPTILVLVGCQLVLVTLRDSRDSNSLHGDRMVTPMLLRIVGTLSRETFGMVGLNRL